ncbi:MAG: hypothetical protein HY744_28925 [Deltaproteobacteria bacterium]|nr:hypothetical protein [Deltaproteobacteria bacterium]
MSEKEIRATIAEICCLLDGQRQRALAPPRVGAAQWLPVVLGAGLAAVACTAEPLLGALSETPTTTSSETTSTGSGAPGGQDPGHFGPDKACGAGGEAGTGGESCAGGGGAGGGGGEVGGAGG